MLSEKQLDANRANAQKSSGPKTQEGKQRSNMNACRHGLTGQVVVLPEEDMEAFNAFAEGIVESLKPFDAHERQLAQSYAGYQWRINRAAAIEDNLFTLGILEEIAGNFNIDDAEVHNAASNAKTFLMGSEQFARLTMYSQRLVNQAEKILKQLKQCQAERLSRQEVEMNSAIKAYKAHREQNVTFDPRENGFDLTIDQLDTFLRRDNLKNSDFLAAEIQRRRSKAA